MKSIVLYSIVLLSIFGCVKQDDEQLLSQNGIRFAVEEINSVATKSEGAVAEDSTICINLSVSDVYEYSTRGMYVNTTTDFKARYQSSGFGVWGYKNSNLVIGSNSAGSKVTFSQGVIWNTATSYQWNSNETMSFYAYAPYTTGASEAITSVDDNSGSPTLSYTTPSTVANQIDVVTAKNENFVVPSDLLVPLHFKHILSAIEFKLSSDLSEGVIKSIAIKGAKTSGTYDIKNESWSGVAGNTDFELTLNKTITADSIAAEVMANNSSQVMFMVPQTFEDQSSATIEVKYTISSNPDKILTIIAPLKSYSWEMGKKYTYFISPVTIYTFNIEDITGLTYQAVTNKTITITSTKLKDRITSNIGWSVEYSATGAEGSWSSTKPSDCWVTVTIPSDLDSSANGTLSAIAENSTTTYTWEVSKGSSGSPYNLSNPTGVAAIENTANCYVINGPGFYKLPLVYGNAIKNGSDNASAYTCVAPNPFMSHLGVAISDPYILNNKTEEGGATNISIPTGSSNATIVWQDVANMITNVSVTGSGATGTFLTFEVSSSVVSATNTSFHGGNAILAVKDSNGDIAWSWHIWVTDYQPGVPNNGDATYTSTTDNVTRTFMRDNLGWVYDDNATYAARSYYLRFIQADSGKDTVITVSSEAATVVSGVSTLYQWGRKDPIPGVDNITGFSISSFIQATYPVAHKNPGMFIKAEGLYTWCSVEYYSSWNAILIGVADSNGVNTCDDKGKPTYKTIYDPSPVGYCVPNSYAFGGFSATNGGTYNYGYTWSGLFFPAPGFRYYSYGDLAYTNGEIGYYWNACASGESSAYYLDFRGLGKSHNTCGRGYGCSVRSVKECEGAATQPDVTLNGYDTGGDIAPSFGL